MNLSYVHLAIAIFSETMATTAMKSSDSFTKLWPSVITIVGYAVAFYFLSLTLRTIPTGIAYAIWSGIGIVLISLMGWFLHGQALDVPAMVGIGFILVGVVIVNTLSKTAGH